MITSIDVGIKNFGIFISEKNYKPIYMNNINLEPYDVEKIVNCLDNIYYEIFKKYNFKEQIVLVEQQLFKNPKIFTIYNHIEMYFYLKFNSKVIFCNSKNKCIEKTTSYSKRKKNSIEQCVKYLQKIKDDDDIDWILELNKHKKKDDISDAICQFIFYFDIFD